MRAIVIPVKAFGDAKSRLASWLSPQARAGLAEAMCADVFAAVAQSRSVDRIFVVSNEPLALESARRNGWDVLVEERQISESASVDLACRHCEAHGVSTLLRIPADIPLVCSSDIEAIFAAGPGMPACVIVPSRDGTGTNALLRAPPAGFPSFFGKDSFARHITAAREADVPVTIIRNTRVELDVDEPADLELLRQCVSIQSRTAQWFSERDRAGQAASGRDRFPQARQG